MADDLEPLDDGLQELEQPEKKEKKGKPMLMYIGIGAGALILNIAVIIVLVKFVFNNNSAETPDKKSKIAKVHGAAEEEGEGGHGGEDEEKEFFAVEKERKFLELGRITTNPKGSSKFIVISIACIYRTKVEFTPEEEKPESEFMRKLIAKIKSTVLNELGNMTVEEIQSKRPNLEATFREKLKPVFKDRQMFLREVIMNEFIIQ